MRQTQEIVAEAGEKSAVIPNPAVAVHVTEAAYHYATTLPAVVAVGSVYDCGKCNQWHLGAFATGWIPPRMALS